MADTIRTIRTITFVLAGVAALICCGGLVWQKDAIVGAFTLNASQAALGEAVLAAAPPGSALRIVNVSEGAGAIVLAVPAPTQLSDEDAAALVDSIWEHYTVAFANGGYAVSHVVLASLGSDGTVSFDGCRHVDVRTLVARTEKPAPALHPLYEDSDGVFDPTTDEPPPFEPPAPLPPAEPR